MVNTVCYSRMNKGNKLGFTYSPFSTRQMRNDKYAIFEKNYSRTVSTLYLFHIFDLSLMYHNMIGMCHFKIEILN